MFPKIYYFLIQVFHACEYANFQRKNIFRVKKKFKQFANHFSNKIYTQRTFQLGLKVKSQLFEPQFDQFIDEFS